MKNDPLIKCLYHLIISVWCGIIATTLMEDSLGLVFALASGWHLKALCAVQSTNVEEYRK